MLKLVFVLFEILKIKMCIGISFLHCSDWNYIFTYGVTPQVSNMQVTSVENKAQDIQCFKDRIYCPRTCAAFLPLSDVAADCFHSSLPTCPSSITGTLASALCGCSMTIFISKWQGNITAQTNVHISAVLCWIMRRISIVNWFKWSFFLPWSKQTRLACAGQQSEEMLEWLVASLILVASSRIRG